MLHDEKLLNKIAAQDGTPQRFEDGVCTVEVDGRDGVLYECYFKTLKCGELKYKCVGPCQQDYHALVTIYGYALDLNDTIYLDHIMQALRVRLFQLDADGTAPEPPSIIVMNRVYEMCPAGSLMRRWLVNFCAYHGVGQCLQSLDLEQQSLHSELAADLIAELDTCVRFPQYFKGLEHIFRKGAPWPYFHSIEGTREELLQRGRSADAGNGAQDSRQRSIVAESSTRNPTQVQQLHANGSFGTKGSIQAPSDDQHNLENSLTPTIKYESFDV